MTTSRGSTDRIRLTDWMASERAFEGRMYPHQARGEVNPDVRLMTMRCDNLGEIAARLRAKGRAPRVCLYALAVGGQEPTHTLGATRVLAVRQGWQVGSNQSYTDRHGVTDPLTRPGWIRVRQQIRSGYADGVVALTRSVVSPHHDEYERQLDWFAAHFGFIALVMPESPAARR